MKYYIQIKDNEIIGKGQAKVLNANVTNIEVTQDVYDNIEQYIYQNGELVLDPEYEEKQQAARQATIDNYTMTALDFINVLRGYGITLEQIDAFIESNLEIKTQLKYCNMVYCGVAKAFTPVTVGEITITPEMVEEAFIARNEGDLV